MEFGIKKCAVLVMKNGGRVTMEGLELPILNSIKILREKNYKYPGILEAGAIKETEFLKSNKSFPQKNKKTCRNQFLQ